MDEILTYPVAYIALAITDAIAEVYKLGQHGLSCRPIKDRKPTKKKPDADLATPGFSNFNKAQK
ncbi:hypothetical protein [Maritalea porphyrae]|uniref:Uncharacterized protein n=2 Tax=Maritalea porphyrae TaxID=880732 RepID=A0ABQ5UQR1_9HYPH|nr:hypothetical protein GCM10007879_11920 [Maritalea porphyrae]